MQDHFNYYYYYYYYYLIRYLDDDSETRLTHHDEDCLGTIRIRTTAAEADGLLSFNGEEKRRCEIEHLTKEQT
jgi:hypothetical protein